MRPVTLLFPLVAAACTGEANHLGNPFLLPVSAMSAGLQNAAYNDRRGAVEIFVKTNHPALVSDIRAGGGPVLQQVHDLAAIPAAIRPEHTLRLQSDLPLYASNMDALILAIMVVAG